ncbi:unnamed protein product [Cylindrotheca closterium]|uniref:ACT domain-containing protein n=1 Tax=Cylindrotheca closterium TaxID=2856 RepID=A0AAD2FBJ4_9STRA|nr:unnamed protein product [Cylindrotheca closterium]
MLSSRRLLTQRASSRRCIERSTTKRIKSTASAGTMHQTADRPTNTQLWRVFRNAAVPMIGFGFTDQTVMLQAGNAIDCTLGVTFGLSTLTAAAFGQIVSDASGVLFGGTVERMAKMAGLSPANLTAAQRALPIVGQARLMGNLAGIVLGCILGLVNLLFIDTGRSSTLKLQAFNEEQQFEFEVEASNAIRNDATVLTVHGPDVDGLLASMTAALSAGGCSIVEIQAKRKDKTDDTEKTAITDTFHVVDKATGEQFDDDDMEALAQALLDSTRTPMNLNSVKAAMNELETSNAVLRSRVKKLEGVIHDRQITLVSSTGAERHPVSMD